MGESGTLHIRGSQSPEELPILLKSVAQCCRQNELLMLRPVCRQSPSFAAVAMWNIDAAVLSTRHANRLMRCSFDLFERRLCHYRSAWRRGFFRAHKRRRSFALEASFWICHGIQKMNCQKPPVEVEILIADFCDSTHMEWMSLHPRKLGNLNSMSFHWHRVFTQGTSGPPRAVQLATRTLVASGAEILKVAAGIRSGSERAFDEHECDITDEVYHNAKIAQTAMDVLVDTAAYMREHPRMFGHYLLEAKADDEALKMEQRDEEERRARQCERGWFVVDESDGRM